VAGTFGLMGRTTAFGTATIGTGADVAASSEGIMSAAANVGTVYVDGAALSTTFFKSANLSTTNNARNLDAIGNLYPVDINLGSINATVALQAYFADTAQLVKFVNGTTFSLAYYFTDAAGNVVVVDIPYAKYSAGSDSGAALNADILVDLTATALRSPTLGYQVQVSFLPA